MTQNELIKQIARTTYVSEDVVKKVIKRQTEIIMNELREGRTVSFYRFCTFGVKLIKGGTKNMFGTTKTLPDRMRPFVKFTEGAKSYFNKR